MSQPAASFLALSCVGAFSTAPAMAADVAPDATDGTGDVIVTGQRAARDANPKQVAPVVDTPRSIVVLPAEVIQQTGSTTLADALRAVPGITFGAGEGGNPLGDRPFIRGFDSQGSIYVDGVRDFSAQTREVFAVDHVQIVRGSDSTLGGRGAAGGTINIVSKLPTTDSFVAADASLGTDNYKRVTVDVNQRLTDTIGARIEGLWHDQDVAGRDAIYQRRWGVAPSVTIGLGTPTRLTAAYYYLESHELPDSGIPYLYTIGNAPAGTTRSQPAVGHVTTASGATGTVDRSAFYGLVDRDFRHTSTEQATLRVEHDFGRVTLRNTARFSHDRQDYIYTQPDDSQGNVYSNGLVWRRANTRYGYADALVDQLDLYGEVKTGAIRHSFAVGAEFDWEKARRGTYVLASGSTITPRCTAAALARYYCTSLFDPDPNDRWVNYASDASTTPAPIVQGAPTAELQNDAETQAAYAFDSITLTPWLIANLGARFDHYATAYTPAVTGTPPVATPIRRSDDLFNWQAGLVVKPTKTTSVYASYATSATPPNSLLGEGREDNALPANMATSANQQIIDALEPQKTRNYEVGAKASLAGDRLQLSAAAFQTDINNARIQIDANTVAFVGRSRVRGIELSANGTILPGWTVFGGYTYLDARILDGGNSALTAPAAFGRAAQVVYVPSVNTGQRMPQTAEHSASIWTNLDLGRFSLGGGAFYVSQVNGGYADNRAAVQDAAGNVTVVPATKTIIRSVPGYWRFDARAAVRVTKRVELSVNVQNLTDKTYFTQAYASHYATIAPGRMAFATLGVKF